MCERCTRPACFRHLPQRFDCFTRPSVCYDWDMPLTAKLSREFYDRFGDKVVNELVGLLNSMDSTFRQELRDLNEQNFRRFEARLDQRTAELGAELRSDMDAMRGEVRHEIAALRQDMTSLKADVIKWMFLFWLGTVATLLGFGRILLAG